MDDAADVRIGVKVRSLRESADLSRHDLARRLNIDVELLGRIERGVARAGLQVVGRLAETFSVPVWTFFLTGPDATSGVPPPNTLQ